MTVFERDFIFAFIRPVIAFCFYSRFCAGNQHLPALLRIVSLPGDTLSGLQPGQPPSIAAAMLLGLPATEISYIKISKLDPEVTMAEANLFDDRDLARQRLRFWIYMLKSARSVETELRERLRTSFDTTLPRFDVMAALYAAPDGLKMTDLSQQLMVSNGNVTGIVDRLVADGLALRQNELSDRRAFRITLTGAGRAKMAVMLEEHLGWIDQLFAAVPAHDLARGIAIMMDLRRKPAPDLSEDAALSGAGAAKP